MLKKMRSSISGQDLVEYALLTGLIAIVLVAGVSLLGTQVSGFFGTAADSVESIYAEPEAEAPPECYGSLLLPIMVGVAGLGVSISHLLPGNEAEVRSV